MTSEDHTGRTQDAQATSGTERPARGISRRDVLTTAGLGASALLVAGASHVANDLPEAVIRGLIDRNVGADPRQAHFKEDALHVITTGTGAPLPDPKRVGPQTVVVAGGQILVFDTGPGSTRKLALTELRISSVNAPFLTHFHSDHISDLGEFMLQRWAGAGATEPLKI